MKKHILTFVNLFILIGTFFLGAFVYRYFSVNAQPPENHAEVSISQDNLWQIVNNWRETHNLATYKLDYYLCGLADEKTNNPPSNWLKENPENQQFIQAMENQGYTTFAVSTSKNQTSAKDVLHQWLTTDSKTNLQSNYTHSCIRCENNYCVQLFAKY